MIDRKLNTSNKKLRLFIFLNVFKRPRLQCWYLLRKSKMWMLFMSIFCSKALKPWLFMVEKVTLTEHILLVVLLPVLYTL